ncbi:uncharacterized protein [Procambarus clarkii]|uniref:uncharacterized protein n=1 Tax=Procambarus clarkii TaxID=6728 RepID=UPI0037429A74
MGLLSSAGLLSTSASGRVGLGSPYIPYFLLLVVVLLLPVGGVEGQTVPEVQCGRDSDCQGTMWTTPLPECVSNRCRCPEGTCVVFSLTSSGDNAYYCGECGTLGSQCNNTMVCEQRWECSGDFCKCSDGYVYWELCVVYEAVPTSVSSFVLIIILAALLILQRLIHSRKAIKKCLCRSSRDSEAEETRAVGYNLESNNKTAAFTIANSDFLATSDDPDLEWGLELSRALSSRGEDWYAMSGSTWSSLPSSTGSLPHTHSSDSRTDSAQPGTSGLRPRLASSGNRSATPSRTRHRCSTRTSISSTSSTASVARPYASSSSSRVRSCTSSIASRCSGTSFNRSSPSLTSNLSSALPSSAYSHDH